MALYAQKANVVTVIPDDAIDDYVAKGYKVMDATGRIIKDAAPTDLNSLKQAYTNLVTDFNNLRAENARLRAELTRAEQVRQAEPKVTEVTSEDPSAPKTRKPRAKKIIEE